MIDKKPPRFSKTGAGPDGFDDDELDDVSVTPEVSAGGQVEDEPIDAEAETAAMIAAQKRRSNLMTAVISVVAALILIAIGYPRFKQYFVADKPVVETSTLTPVPQTVRKNYFTNSDNGTQPANNGTVTPDATAGGGAPGAPADGNASPAAASAALPLPPASTATGPNAADGSSSTAGPAASTAPTLPTNVTAPSTTDVTAVQAQAPALSQTPVAQPAAAAPAAPVVDQGTATLKDSLDKLTALHDSDEARIQALQASITELQKQIASVAAAKPDTQVVAVKPPHTARVKSRAVGTNTWVLRSATNDMALIGHSGSDELKKIAPGDVVSGLGKITSIEEQNGSWVVHGTAGSVEQ